MSELRLQVVFAGEVAEGRNPDQVKKELASLAILNPEQLDQAFAGSPVVLMQELSSDQAQRYEAALKTTGAVCQLLPRGETGSPPPTHDDTVILSQGTDPLAEEIPELTAVPVDPAPPPPETSSELPGTAVEPSTSEPNPVAGSPLPPTVEVTPVLEPHAVALSESQQPVVADSSPPPTAAPPPAVSPGQGQKKITCPKCGFDQEEAPECFQCGVIIEKFRERAGFEEDEVARLAAAGIQLGPAPDEELVDDSFFAPEKKGLEKGMAGGIVMMVIAVVWFVAGWAAGIIFYYPPVLFLIGLFGFFKGFLSGNVAG